MSTPRSQVLMTGAHGFLGSHLERAFITRGHVVHRLVRDPKQMRDGDILLENAPALCDAFRARPGAILVHCAAFTSAATGVSGFEEELQANIDLPVRLFEAAGASRLAGIINVGSFWEHDATGQIAPFNAYAAMKVTAQRYLDTVSMRHGCPAITLKLSETYAPDDPRPKLLPLLIRTALNDGSLDLTEGLQSTSFTHVTDVCEAFCTAIARIEQGSTKGHEAFHVNSGVLTSIRDVAGIIRDAIPGSRAQFNWGAKAARPGLPLAAYIGGPRLPGWQPKIDLASGIAQWVAQSGGAAT